jgi:hypothetical protein
MNLTNINGIFAELKNYDGFNTKYPKVWVIKFLIPIFKMFIGLMAEMDSYIKSEISGLRSWSEGQFTESKSNMNSVVQASSDKSKSDLETTKKELKQYVDTKEKSLQEQIDDLTKKINEKV